MNDQVALEAQQKLVDDAVADLLRDHDPRSTDRVDFRGHQFDRGLAWVHFPEGDGGLGVRPELQGAVARTLRRSGASPAGSDFAGLGTRAAPDGDEWVIDGQKVWNTIAHIADRGMLVTRSNPELPKYEGLTYFALDMRAAIDAFRRTEPHLRTAINQDRLMRLWVDAETLRLTNTRASQNRRVGNPGPERSVGKLRLAEHNQELYDFVLDLEGTAAMVGYDYTFRRSVTLSADGAEQGPHHAFLRVRANSIEGGTSEIMRNILGEQVLGLPGEPRVDKDVPWSDVPRS